MKRHFILDMYVRGSHWMSNMCYVPLHVWPCRYLIDLGNSFPRIYSEICEQLKGGKYIKGCLLKILKVCFYIFAKLLFLKIIFWYEFFFSFTKMIYNFGAWLLEEPNFFFFDLIKKFNFILVYNLFFYILFLKSFFIIIITWSLFHK